MQAKGISLRCLPTKRGGRQKRRLEKRGMCALPSFLPSGIGIRKNTADSLSEVAQNKPPNWTNMNTFFLRRPILRLHAINLHLHNISGIAAMHIFREKINRFQASVLSNPNRSHQWASSLLHWDSEDHMENSGDTRGLSINNSPVHLTGRLLGGFTRPSH